MGHDRSAVTRRIGQRAWLKQREIGVIASVERQGFNRMLADQITELGGFRVDPQRTRTDRHQFRDAADLQHDRHRHRFTHREHEVLRHVRTETGQFGAHFVASDRQRGEHEPAVGAGDTGPRETGVGVPDRDLHARQDASRRVCHRTGQRRGRLR